MSFLLSVPCGNTPALTRFFPSAAATDGEDWEIRNALGMVSRAIRDRAVTADLQTKNSQDTGMGDSYSNHPPYIP